MAKLGNSSFRWAINIPNCVPQSPTWFSLCSKEEFQPAQCHHHPFSPLPSPPSPPTYLSTSCPTYSRSRESVSPMMVERRCPTCISLAMLGEEKSITTLFFSTAGGLTPFTRMSVTSCDTKSVRRKMLTKPGPATSQRSMQRSTTSEGDRLATIDSATLGGGRVWPCAFRV